jgi:methylated-DNA-[protein]-cysteine S-methyltransferase
MKLLLEKIPSPIGTMLLIHDGAAIRSLDFEDYEPRMMQLLRRHYGEVELVEGKAPPEVHDAMDAYFAGTIGAIDRLETATAGTEFQREVWRTLRKIPAGATWSYGQLAAHIGRPRAMRAVGLANGSNPIAIVVPCHRVIGADGGLTGYGGGIERKRWLLHHEGAAFA